MFSKIMLNQHNIFEARCGENIYNSIDKILEMRKHYDSDIFLLFNGACIRIKEHTTKSDILKEYRSHLHMVDLWSLEKLATEKIKDGKPNTPKEIFIQEGDKSMRYGINQDASASGMVKYIREDTLPYWRRFSNGYQAETHIEGENLESGNRYIPIKELFNLPKED